jgi:uncharacterized protein YkwD
VNAERSKRGLGILKRNPQLESSAQLYAKTMAAQGFFGHVSPSGETLKDRMQKSGFYQPFFQADCFCIARFVMGENLGKGQRTPFEVVRDWMQSTAHRETLLDAQFTDTGIGLSGGVWVEHFGGRQN